MRQEWACPFCHFSKVSAALWRICRHIIGRLTIRDYIYQVSARCPPSKLLRNLQLHARFQEKVYCHEWFIIDRYVKNTLRIDSKQRLPCFGRYYGVNVEESLAFGWINYYYFFGSQTWRRKRTDFSCTNNLSGKLNICYLTESLLIESIRSSSKVNDLLNVFAGFCENVAC